MTIYKFNAKLFFLIIICSLSACKTSVSEEDSDDNLDEVAVTSDVAKEVNLSDYSEVEQIGVQVFNLLKTLGSEEEKLITTLMPSFKTCKEFYYKKNKSRNYPIENYDKSVGWSIENIKTITEADSIINWNAIVFRDFSYSTYKNGSNQPFGMVADKSGFDDADFIEGWLNFKNNEQNYKVKIFGQKMLGKWYVVRLERLMDAFTY